MLQIAASMSLDRHHAALHAGANRRAPPAQSLIDLSSCDPAKVPETMNRSFQLADVAAQMIGQKSQDFIGDGWTHCCFRSQQSEPGIAIGRQQAPDRSAQEPIDQFGH